MYHTRLEALLVPSIQSGWVALAPAARRMYAGGLSLAVRSLGACICACLLLQPAYATEPAQAAKMLEASTPEYPSAARRREEQGTVLVRVRVLASGQAGEVQVHKSSGMPELDKAAVAAAKASKFRPAQSVEGVPLDSWVAVPYKFVLQE